MESHNSRYSLKIPPKLFQSESITLVSVFPNTSFHNSRNAMACGRSHAPQGFESKAKGLRLETVAANVMSSEDYGYMMNADIPCSKTGTPFQYIHEVHSYSTFKACYPLRI